MSARPSTPSAQAIIGLDAGTTGVKAVMFELGTRRRAVAIREYPLLEPEPDMQVQEPQAILAAAASALSEAAAAAAAQGAEVLAISVSTAMHGLLGLDAAARPLTPLITWADARARREARELRAPGSPPLHEITGAPVHPMTPLVKLAWMRRHDPAGLHAARWWVGLKELLLHWLTGEIVTELSSASGTGLLDMRRRTWSEEAAGVAGVSLEQLPPILPTTATLTLSTAAARETGLPAGLPVVAGAADGPLGNLGTGAIEPGIACLTLGTSGAVRTAIEEPRIDRERTLFCYALTDSLWIAGGAVSNGGVVARWVARTLLDDGPARPGRPGAPGQPGPLAPAAPVPAHLDAAVLALAASAPPGCEGLVMLPYLLAERAPLWDPDLPGAYLGLRRHHTRAHLARAAIEGVCLGLRLILDRLDEVAPVQSLRITGRPFGAALWREVMAGMVARPLMPAGDAEGTALGAAALGLTAIGAAPGLGEAVTMLAGDLARGAAIAPDPSLVEAYDRIRASIPERIDELERVAGLLRPSS